MDNILSDMTTIMHMQETGFIYTIISVIIAPGLCNFFKEGAIIKTKKKYKIFLFNEIYTFK